MNFSILKFNEDFSKEISALKRTDSDQTLHPLKLDQIKKNLLSRMETEPSEATRVMRHGWNSRVNKLVKVILPVLVGVSLIGGTVFAAQGSIPGGKLYRIKRALENAQLSLTLGASAKATLAENQAQTRFTEWNSTKASANTNANVNNQASAQVAATQVTEGLQSSVATLTAIQNNYKQRGDTTDADEIGSDINLIEQQSLSLGLNLGLGNPPSSPVNTVNAPVNAANGESKPANSSTPPTTPHSTAPSSSLNPGTDANSSYGTNSTGLLGNVSSDLNVNLNLGLTGGSSTTSNSSTASSPSSASTANSASSTSIGSTVGGVVGAVGGLLH